MECGQNEKGEVTLSLEYEGLNKVVEAGQMILIDDA